MFAGGNTVKRMEKLMRKEEDRRINHPATALARRRFLQYNDKGAKTMPSFGSVLQIGLNGDPMKVKYLVKEGLAFNPSLPSREVRDTVMLSPKRRLSIMASTKHYLNEQNELVKNPHLARGNPGGGFSASIASQVGDDFRELLYNGVSSEYEGRYAYLKAKRKLLRPGLRTRGPVTSSQSGVWALENPNATSHWAPEYQRTGNRGVMLRLMSEDAPTLMKNTDIVRNRQIMETMLGAKRGD